LRTSRSPAHSRYGRSQRARVVAQQVVGVGAHPRRRPHRQHADRLADLLWRALDSQNWDVVVVAQQGATVGALGEAKRRRGRL